MIDAICRSLLTVNISSRHDSYAPDDTSFVYVRILLGWNEHGFHHAAFHDNSWIESKQRRELEIVFLASMLISSASSDSSWINFKQFAK